MASKGKKRKKDEKPSESFPFIDTTDTKIRKTFVLMLEKFNEQEREVVRKTYADTKLRQSYEQLRNSGIYQEGGGKAHHRKIAEFPNPETWRFVDAVMSDLYGDDWLYNNKALRHELVKPWWVIKKL